MRAKYRFGRDEDSDMYWFQIDDDSCIWLTSIECPIGTKRDDVLSEALEAICEELNKRAVKE